LFLFPLDDRLTDRDIYFNCLLGSLQLFPKCIKVGHSRFKIYPNSSFANLNLPMLLYFLTAKKKVLPVYCSIFNFNQTFLINLSKIQKFRTNYVGCCVVQACNTRLLAAEIPVQFKTRLYVIFCEQSGTGTGFSPKTFGSLCPYYYTNSRYRFTRLSSTLWNLKTGCVFK
jgi:hypothetical protein